MLGQRLVGEWTTEATHPGVPGTVVHGTARVEWLEGQQFLILRSRSDHPDFPDSISIIGDTDEKRARRLVHERDELADVVVGNLQAGEIQEAKVPYASVS